MKAKVKTISNPNSSEIPAQSSVSQEVANEPKDFTISAQNLNLLAAAIAKLPWEAANPLIQFIQQNFKPIEL